MFKFRIVPLVLSALVASCEHDKDDSSVLEENALTGTWISNCTTDDSYPDDIEYYIEEVTFIDSNVSIQYTLFETDSCVSQLSQFNVDATYTLGTTYKTDSNDEVQDINIQMSSNFEILDIYKIESNYLYLGVERDDELRPTDIDYNFWYEKQ